VVSPLPGKVVLLIWILAVEQHHDAAICRVAGCNQATSEDLEDGLDDASLIDICIRLASKYSKYLDGSTPDCQYSCLCYFLWSALCRLRCREEERPPLFKISRLR
jgi:hypothetical protein